MPAIDCLGRGETKAGTVIIRLCYMAINVMSEVNRPTGPSRAPDPLPWDPRVIEEKAGVDGACRGEKTR